MTTEGHRPSSSHPSPATRRSEPSAHNSCHQGSPRDPSLPGCPSQLSSASCLDPRGASGSQMIPVGTPPCVASPTVPHASSHSFLATPRPPTPQQATHSRTSPPALHAGHRLPPKALKHLPLLCSSWALPAPSATPTATSVEPQYRATGLLLSHSLRQCPYKPKEARAAFRAPQAQATASWALPSCPPGPHPGLCPALSLHAPTCTGSLGPGAEGGWAAR